MNIKILIGMVLISICIAPTNGMSKSTFPTSLSMTESVLEKQIFTVGKLQVTASTKTILVSIDDKTVFELPSRIAMDVGELRDSDLFVPTFRTEGDRCVWTVKSSNWEKKEYSLSAEGSAVVLRTKIFGTGKLGKLRFFEENRETGQSLYYEVSRYFVPVAMGAVNSLPQWRNPMEDGESRIAYLAPPLLAFSFKGLFDGHCAFGLAPRPGAYNLDHFKCEFSTRKNGLFSTDFYEYTEVTGEYDLPAITITAGTDEYDALAAHSEWLYQFGGCHKVDRSVVPRWWLGPIFCGWGEQGYLSPANKYDGANQKDYTRMSNRLNELGLEPTLMIIDDKWQQTYGGLLPDTEKWPDLRAFVDAEHAKGRRVLLWMKSWNSEGLDPEECITKDGVVIGADPTSPVYQKRIRETMYKLLSSDLGCFNCDGLKIDFASTIPKGNNLVMHESGVYGIELMKRLFALIYESAKAAKSDCLINTSCAHPYFAEVTDQARLHDYNSNIRAIWEVRSFRTKLFQSALPGISIDTDSPNSSSKREMLDYIYRSPELGIPVLYQLHSRGRDSLTDDDFRNIAKMWKEYSSKLDEK